jgi:hypothetical protein
MESISCAGLTSRVKQSRARKYQHKHEFFLKRLHLLNSWLFGGSFHERNKQHFYIYFFAGWGAKRVEQLKHFLDSKTREAHNTT